MKTKGLLNFKKCGLKNVNDFIPYAAIHFKLSNNYHLIAVGTDKSQNKIVGLWFQTDKEGRIDGSPPARLSLITKGRHLTKKVLEKEALDVVQNSGLCKPHIIAASFPLQISLL